MNIYKAEWVDQSTWQEFGQPIDFSIRIRSLPMGASIFKATFDNFQGKLLDDKFSPVTPKGPGSRIMFKINNTKIFFGRIWAIDPMVDNRGERVIISGEGYERELFKRSAAKGYKRDDGDVDDILSTMLTDTNNKDYDGTTYPFMDLETSIVIHSDFTGKKLAFESSSRRNAYIINYIKDISDTWQIDAFIKYWLDRDSGRLPYYPPTGGAQINLLLLSDIPTVTALKHDTVLKYKQFASDNNIVEIDSRWDVNLIRNLIYFKPPVPSLDEYTEGISTGEGDNWVAETSCTIEAVTMLPPSMGTQRPKKGGYSILGWRIDSEGLLSIYLDVETAIGGYLPVLDLGLENMLFAYRQKVGITQGLHTRLWDTEDNIIGRTETWLATTDWIYMALHIGNMDHWSQEVGSTFNWKIKKIQFQQDNSPFPCPLAIDALSFEPIPSTFTYQIKDNTSIINYGLAEETAEPALKTAADIVDYAWGLLKGFKDPVFFLELKLNHSPETELLCPGCGVKVEIPHYGLDGTKYWRILEVEYRLDEEGFFTFVTVTPAEDL